MCERDGDLFLSVPSGASMSIRTQLAGALIFVITWPLILSSDLRAEQRAGFLSGMYKVVYVYDGDTIIVLVGTDRIRIRLAEINTAERNKPKCAAERSMAQLQREILERRVSAYVRVEQFDVGFYGRPIARVYNEAGEDLSAYMLSHGRAKRYGEPGSKDWC